MRGTKAKRLRRENPKPDLGYRPPQYTHPVNPDLPSRKERRAAHKRLKVEHIRLAARKRDREAKRRGVPTPAESIRKAIKRGGLRYVNDPQGWRLFAPRFKRITPPLWRPGQ